MKKDPSPLYEKFHKRTKSQKRVIGKKNFTYRNLIEILEKYVNDENKILDIGCGSGVISLFLASRGKQVLGIDISRSSINACREGAKNLGLKEKAVFKVVDFPREKLNRKFDIVICSEVLEHIEEDEKAVEEIYNLLTPGGLLIISVPSKNAPLYSLGYAKKFDIKVGHLRRYNCQELNDLCRRAGFNIIETRRTEGLLRNFLFLNPLVGKTIKFIRGPISGSVTALDNVILKFFGESQIFVVARKK